MEEEKFGPSEEHQQQEVTTCVYTFEDAKDIVEEAEETMTMLFKYKSISPRDGDERQE